MYPDFNVYASLLPGAGAGGLVRLGLRASSRGVQEGSGGWASVAVTRYPGRMSAAHAAIVRAAPPAPSPSAAGDGNGTTVAGYVLPDWSYFPEDINAARGNLALSDARAQSSADGEGGGRGCASPPRAEPAGQLPSLRPEEAAVPPSAASSSSLHTPVLLPPSSTLNPSPPRRLALQAP